MFGLSILSLVVGAAVGATVAPVTKFFVKQVSSVESKVKAEETKVANTVTSAVSSVEKKL